MVYGIWYIGIYLLLYRLAVEAMQRALTYIRLHRRTGCHPEFSSSSRVALGPFATRVFLFSFSQWIYIFYASIQYIIIILYRCNIYIYMFIRRHMRPLSAIVCEWKYFIYYYTIVIVIIVIIIIFIIIVTVIIIVVIIIKLLYYYNITVVRTSL